MNRSIHRLVKVLHVKSLTAKPRVRRRVIVADGELFVVIGSRVRTV